jgi:hypothetical protein
VSPTKFICTIKLTSAAGPVMSPLPWPTRKSVCCCVHTAEPVRAQASAQTNTVFHIMVNEEAYSSLCLEFGTCTAECWAAGHHARDHRCC